jgi:hypothetical protein
LETLQHQILPFGSALALFVVGWAAWQFRKPGGIRQIVRVFVAGTVAASILVAAMHVLRRLPWLFACLDCLAQYWWFSYALTFIQGFGFFSGLAVLMLPLYSRRNGQPA